MSAGVKYVVGAALAAGAYCVLDDARRSAAEEHLAADQRAEADALRREIEIADLRVELESKGGDPGAVRAAYDKELAAASSTAQVVGQITSGA